ncbi:hypothetical protein GCT19_25775 [Paraburkholderia sp. CNPSo 3155]|nr:hypothetical protein [Paraburkholderia atlantica]
MKNLAEIACKTASPRQRELVELALPTNLQVDEQSEIDVLGIDLAKQIFQLHGADRLRAHPAAFSASSSFGANMG